MVRKCVPNEETINLNGTPVPYGLNLHREAKEVQAVGYRSSKKKNMGKEGFEPSTPRFGDACSYSTELQARAYIYYQLNLGMEVKLKTKLLAY